MIKNNNNILIWLILFLALTIRILLATLPGFKIDVDAWFAWALRINEVGFSNFYSSQVWTNYTPGYLYILGLLGLLKNILNLNSSYFYFLLKLPSIIAEIVLGIIVYKLSLHIFSKKISLFATSLVLFNPSFIFNSSVWGQIDGFLTLFLVLSVLYLKKNNLIFASIFFSIALLIKPQALAITPVLFLYLVKNFSFSNFLKLSLPTLSFFFLLSIPFFPTNPVGGIINLLKSMVNDYSYTSLFAYNLWALIGFWINDSEGFILPFSEIGTLLLVFYWVVLVIFFFKKNIGLFALSALATLAFYFLPTRVHDRYLYPSLVFLILTAIELKSVKLFWIQLLLSFIHFFNLYFVYVYYNELFLKLPKLLYHSAIFNFLNNYYKILSIISSLVFICISYIIIKCSKKSPDPKLY